jgi:hypothetical protein
MTSVNEMSRKSAQTRSAKLNLSQGPGQGYLNCHVKVIAMHTIVLLLLLQGRMNYCLRNKCPSGYAFIKGFPFKLDSHGSFR